MRGKNYIRLLRNCQQAEWNELFIQRKKNLEIWTLWNSPRVKERKRLSKANPNLREFVVSRCRHALQEMWRTFFRKKKNKNDEKLGYTFKKKCIREGIGEDKSKTFIFLILAVCSNNNWNQVHTHLLTCKLTCFTYMFCYYQVRALPIKQNNVIWKWTWIKSLPITNSRATRNFQNTCNW